MMWYVIRLQDLIYLSYNIQIRQKLYHAITKPGVGDAILLPSAPWSDPPTFAIWFFSPSLQTVSLVFKFSVVSFFHHLHRRLDWFSLWLPIRWLVFNNTQLLLAVLWQSYGLSFWSKPAKVVVVSSQDEVIWTKILYVKPTGPVDATRIFYMRGE